MVRVCNLQGEQSDSQRGSQIVSEAAADGERQSHMVGALRCPQRPLHKRRVFAGLGFAMPVNGLAGWLRELLPIDRYNRCTRAHMVMVMVMVTVMAVTGW